METSESIAAISPAFSKAQQALESASKSSENPFFNSKYADLSEVMRCIKEVTFINGLCFTQHPSYEGNLVTVETTVIHAESGEYFRSICKTPAPKSDPQGTGSAITYLRRFALASIFGLAQEDDDGNSHAAPQKQSAPAKTQQASSLCNVKIYPQDSFVQNLPRWKQKMKADKNFCQELFDKVNKKGFTFSENQIYQLSDEVPFE